MSQINMLSGSLNPLNVVKCLRYKRKFKLDHPTYFDPCGLLVFCGSQGSGKTLSAVQYVKRLCELYPRCILCTNVKIFGLPLHTRVVDYDGLQCLTRLENGYEGIIYLIDEIHLEFNSLESSDIPIEVMIEVSQQRKQRKHIVGTSQVFGRMSKQFREQVKYVVVCKNYFGLLQSNALINAEEAEQDGTELRGGVVHRYFWLHTPELYQAYDTYAKMQRYRREWRNIGRNRRSLREKDD